MSSGMKTDLRATAAFFIGAVPALMIVTLLGLPLVYEAQWVALMGAVAYFLGRRDVRRNTLTPHSQSDPEQPHP